MHIDSVEIESQSDSFCSFSTRESLKITQSYQEKESLRVTESLCLKSTNSTMCSFHNPSHIT